MRYVMRGDRKIEVVDVNIEEFKSKKTRKRFKVEWVQFPQRWIEVLRQSKRVSTYQLALVVLAEDFKHKHIWGEVVLSSATTQMPRSTRTEAVKELVRLGLIQARQEGNHAWVVSNVYY